MTDSGTAQELIDAGAQRAPLSPGALMDLFFRPTRYFLTVWLAAPGVWLVAAYLFGAFQTIERFDSIVARVEAGGSRAGWDLFGAHLADSWLYYWLYVLVAGTVAGWARWYVGGWWYRRRLRWSGAVDVDPREARLVYTYSGLVLALPVLVAYLVATFAHENYAAFNQSESEWIGLLIVFPFWAVICSYRGVRARFAIRGAAGTIWMLVLPILMYMLAIGVAAAAFAFAEMEAG